MNTDVRIVAPGQMETPAGEIPYLFLPARDLFARRAERLRRLSGGNPLGEYLAFLALLADAQQNALNRLSALPLPPPRHNEPPLSARSLQRDPAWRQALAAILEQMSTAALPSAASRTVAGLMHASTTALEERADRILAGDLSDVAPQEQPFVSAALQTYFVQMASSLSQDAVGRPEAGGLCPVCGSLPTAGMVRGEGREQGLRYLSCSLCASEWHLVRLTCGGCGSTEGIDYYALEGSNGAVKAESCGACNSYLKLLYLGKDALMEPVADDLATLSLDVLMDASGRTRIGPNLLFHPGKPQGANGVPA